MSALLLVPFIETIEIVQPKNKNQSYASSQTATDSFRLNQVKRKESFTDGKETSMMTTSQSARRRIAKPLFAPRSISSSMIHPR